MPRDASNIEVDVVPQALSASTLIGTEVFNSRGEKLGKIEELRIDLPRGCVAYVALSFGGFLGFGDKLFAVPWQALRFDTRNDRILLDVDLEALENAPGFDKDDWSGTDDEGWLRGVYIYYGHLPYWENG